MGPGLTATPAATTPDAPASRCPFQASPRPAREPYRPLRPEPTQAGCPAGGNVRYRLDRLRTPDPRPRRRSVHSPGRSSATGGPDASRRRRSSAASPVPVVDALHAARGRVPSMHILSSSPIVDGRPTDVDACAGCEGEQRPDRREPTSAVPRRDLVASPRRRSTPCRDRPRAASTGSRGLAGSTPVTPERDGRGGSARRGACRETGSRSIEGTPDRVQIAAGRQAPGR